MLFCVLFIVAGIAYQIEPFSKTEHSDFSVVFIDDGSDKARKMYDVFSEALEMLQKRDDREKDEVRLARFAHLSSSEAGKYLEGLDESKGPDLVLI